MRLICPNCGAQYEVAEDVIPTEGRDVQCSNCAHTWFETPGASARREAGEDDTPPQDNVTPDTVDAFVDRARPTEDASRDTKAQQTESEAEEQGFDAPDLDETPERKTVTPTVAEILQSEAAREESKRQAEAQPALESQSDMNLDEGPDRENQLAEEARRRMARLKGEAAPAIGAATAVAAGTRSDLLPDIDEINSSLRSDSERQEENRDPATTDTKRRGGFRRGFFTVILLVILAVILYLLAPRISAAVPALEPALTAYVDTINGWRLWLNSLIRG